MFYQGLSLQCLHFSDALEHLRCGFFDETIARRRCEDFQLHFAVLIVHAGIVLLQLPRREFGLFVFFLQLRFLLLGETSSSLGWLFPFLGGIDSFQLSIFGLLNTPQIKGLTFLGLSQVCGSFLKLLLQGCNFFLQGNFFWVWFGGRRGGFQSWQLARGGWAPSPLEAALAPQWWSGSERAETEAATAATSEGLVAAVQAPGTIIVAIADAVFAGSVVPLDAWFSKGDRFERHAMTTVVAARFIIIRDDGRGLDPGGRRCLSSRDQMVGQGGSYSLILSTLLAAVVVVAAAVVM